MAHVVVMPALGNTVESCLVTAWMVAVGDTVDPGTVLCDIETDKSAMEIPAGVSGTVLALLAEEGDEVPVKAPIVVVGDAGESVEEVLANAGLPPLTSGEAGEVDEVGADQLAPAASDQDAPATPVAESASSATPQAGTPDAAASPRARATASRDVIDVASVGAGSGPGGRVLERDVLAAKASGRPTAAAKGAAWSGVAGTGIGGRVTSADAAGSPGAVPLSELVAAQAAATASDDDYTDTPLKGVRKLIAERMTHALAVSAQLTYTATAKADPMLALRRRFKGSGEALGYQGITLGDLVCFATVRVLTRHASLNAHLLDGTLRTFRPVHLGLAVDTPRGLLVPTIRDADSLSLRELSARTKELAGQAQSGHIEPELLAGATFTVSNLGSFGIESFTPIINVPQTGILGVNAIVPRATIDPDGGVGVEQRIGFSLTADHQVVDGADAARFLRDLAVAIENIDLTVMG